MALDTAREQRNLDFDLDNVEDPLISKLHFWRRSPSSIHHTALDRARESCKTREDIEAFVFNIEHPPPEWLDPISSDPNAMCYQRHQRWLSFLKWKNSRRQRFKEWFGNTFIRPFC